MEIDPIVLIVGCPGSGKTILMQEILHYHELCQNSAIYDSALAELTFETREVKLSHDDQEVLIFNEAKWGFQTKYYSAKLSLWDLQEIKRGDLVLAALSQCDDIQGIVMVFDPCQDQSFEDLRVWFELSRMKDIDLQVCLANRPGKESKKQVSGADQATESTTGSIQPQDQEENLSRYIEACLDSGFEFILADLLNPTTGHDLREKDGVPRLIEALQSTQWRNMDFQTPSPKKTTESDKARANIQPTLPNDPLKNAQELPKVPEIEVEPQKPTQALESLSEGLFTEEGLLEDDSVVKLINEVQRIRDCSQNLPDSQRKDIASAAALKLLEILDISDGEDSSDEA